MPHPAGPASLDPITRSGGAPIQTIQASRRMSKSGFRALALLGGVVILGMLASPQKAAAGTVSVIEDVSGTPGNWTLDFSVQNNLTPGFDVYFFGLPTLANTSDVITGSPWGWAPDNGGVAWCVLPAQCFSSVSNNGGTTSGFQVQSDDVQHPEPLPFVVYAIDWTNSNPPDPGCFNCGFNPGYTGTTQIPEPTAWLLLGTSITVLALASIDRSRWARFARMFLPRGVSYSGLF